MIIVTIVDWWRRWGESTASQGKCGKDQLAMELRPAQGLPFLRAHTEPAMNEMLGTTSLWWKGRWAHLSWHDSIKERLAQISVVLGISLFCSYSHVAASVRNVTSAQEGVRSRPVKDIRAFWMSEESISTESDTHLDPEQRPFLSNKCSWGDGYSPIPQPPAVNCFNPPPQLYGGRNSSGDWSKSRSGCKQN